MEAKVGMCKGPVDGHEEYCDESRESTMAALVLSSLKYQKLDPTTAATLQDLKTKFLGKATTTTSSGNNIINIDNVQQPTKTLEEEEEEEASHNNNNNNGIIINNNSTISESIIMEIENYVAPEIPPIPKLEGKIGRCSIPFEKQLTVSDVKKDQARLTINKCYAKACLEPLLNDNEKPEEGIPVTVYDKDGKEYKMTIKNWGKVYVLSGRRWKDLYHKHQLKSHQHFVTLWIFRHAYTSELCVAITYRELPTLSQPYKKNFNIIAHHPST